jgi:hypothetical protein
LLRLLRMAVDEHRRPKADAAGPASDHTSGIDPSASESTLGDAAARGL